MDRRRGPWLRWDAKAMKIRMDVDGTRITATLDEGTPSSSSFQERTKGGTQAEAEALFNNLKRYALAGKSSTSEVPAPACTQQGLFEPIYGSGPATQYQHTFEQPQP
jgi:hypothetical protein